jgi:hypothetical protein
MVCFSFEPAWKQETPLQSQNSDATEFRGKNPTNSKGFDFSTNLGGLGKTNPPDLSLICFY